MLDIEAERIVQQLFAALANVGPWHIAAFCGGAAIGRNGGIADIATMRFEWRAAFFVTVP